MEPLQDGLFGDSEKWLSFQFEAQKSIWITLNYYHPQSQDIFPFLPVSQRKMAEKKEENDHNFSSKTLNGYIMFLFWRKRLSLVKTIFSTFIEAREWQETSDKRKQSCSKGLFLCLEAGRFPTRPHAREKALETSCNVTENGSTR